MTKTFYTQQNIGRIKYLVNYHDGVETHDDGSPFFKVGIFKNKKIMADFIKKLEAEGYNDKRAEMTIEADDNSAQNNRLIAEFLGATENSGGEFEMYGIIEGIDDDLYTEHFYFAKEMKFNSSWDWIMQAVLKIENLQQFEYCGRKWLYFDVDIFRQKKTKDNYCTIKYLKESGEMTIASGFSKKSKIEAVNKAVIEFINWYNDNAQK